MASRRMFAKTIIDSDAFLTLPLSAQALYFHLSMRGDDEGFVNKPKSIMRTIGANDDDIKLLIAKKFIIPFDSGIVVIKHWKIHNYIRGDRIKKTVYQDEKNMLKEKENGSYTLFLTNIDGQLSDSCQADDGQVAAQVRLGKVRLGKDRLDKDIYITCQHLSMTEKEYSKLVSLYGESAVKEKIEYAENYKNLKKYVSLYLTLNNWLRKDKKEDKYADIKR